MAVFLSSLLALASAQSAASPVSATFKPDPASASALFEKLEGQWACSGAFANGKPLAADLGFAPSFDGLALRYTHVDRAPNSYKQESHWAVDSETGQLVSLAVTSFAKGKANAAFYVAEALTDVSVTFAHRRLVADPFAPNRFTYSVTKSGKLKMLWEVNRNGNWRMGDALDCTRAAS